MQKIIPCLWFDKQAEDAAKFYTSLFDNSNIGNIVRYPAVGKEIHGQDEGTVMTVDFTLEGYQFTALNGGPVFTFTPAISFMVVCESKEKVEKLWNALIDGGKALMPLDTYDFSAHYGWVQDKYGLSWQIMYKSDVSKTAIHPSMMFVKDLTGRAEEAMNFYLKNFENSKVGDIARYGENNPQENPNHIMYADFFLEEQKFSIMENSLADHTFVFNEAISFMVMCDDQTELDTFWNAMSAVPAAEQCGWIKDMFGVSWQITPRGMEEFLSHPDKEKVNKVMNAMLKMKKIDIDELQKAFNS